MQACADDSAKAAEGKALVAQLARLKYEVQHDRALEPLGDDGEPDVAAYNAELARRGPLTWCAAPWLFAECYLFRRMSTLFRTSAHWPRHDVFARTKLSTFRASRPAVVELAARYHQLMAALDRDGGDGAAEQTLFHEVCEICLWGNATDLSLLTSLTYEDLQKLQGAAARKQAEANILVNDLPAAYSLLTAARHAAAPGAARRVDIVLDNAGFELYVDLVLAAYLLRAGLATVVVLHPKNIPWFVSDVLPSDFAALLNALADPARFYETRSDDDRMRDPPPPPPTPLTAAESADLAFVFADWTRLYANGQLVLRPNIFWTQPGSFWRLPADAPALMEDLQTSELVIFKGDLNYRKLTCDVCCLAPGPRPPLLCVASLTVFSNLPLLTCHPPPLGRLGRHHPLCRRHWPAGPRLRPQCPRPAHVQGRCRRGPAPGQGRGAAPDGGRRRRLRRA